MNGIYEGWDDIPETTWQYVEAWDEDYQDIINEQPNQVLTNKTTNNMRYTISKENENGKREYIYKDFPHITWTEYENIALRMHPERAAKLSYHLMLLGHPHQINKAII